MIGYPKQKQIKRRLKHPKSILHAKDGTCYLCTKLHEDIRKKKGLEEHHVFPGSFGRKASEQNGLKVYLCPEHHRTGSEAVHREHRFLQMIQEDAQREYEKTHTRGEWMDLIGRNYL